MKFDKHEIMESINAALAESFEGLAFIEFDSWEEIYEIPEIADRQYLTSVDIRVPFVAKLSILCSRPFIYNTIESITGEEIEDDESIVSDTLREVLNTITGRFMVDLLTDGVEFDFGIPDFQIYEKGTLTVNESDIVMKFIYDEESVLCVFNEA